MIKRRMQTTPLFWGVLLLLALAAAWPAAAAVYTERYERPIPMGVSISTTPSSPYIFAGTAGMLVSSAVPAANGVSQLYILSNNHVMGAVGPGLCPNSAPIGTPILQPGTLDIGNDPGDDPYYRVAELSAFKRLRFFPLFRNYMDAAIAATDPTQASAEIIGIGYPATQLATATPGMQVTKSGRTTGVTTGTVEAVNSSVIVSYGGFPCVVARFVNQVMLSDMSDGGDSGSVILEQGTLKPVALLFAGSDTTTIATPMQTVTTEFNVWPVGQTGPLPRREIMKARAELERQGPLSIGDPAIFERMREFQEANEETLLGIPSVAGIGIGLAENGHDLTFVVYCEAVTRETRDLVQGIIDRFDVRFVESGPFKAQ